MIFQLEDNKKWTQLLHFLKTCADGGKQTVVFVWSCSDGWLMMQNSEHLDNLDCANLVLLGRFKAAFFTGITPSSSELDDQQSNNSIKNMAFEMNVSNFYKAVRRQRAGTQRVIFSLEMNNSNPTDSQQTLGTLNIRINGDEGQFEMHKEVIIKRNLNMRLYFNEMENIVSENACVFEVQQQYLHSLHECSNRVISVTFSEKSIEFQALHDDRDIIVQLPATTCNSYNYSAITDSFSKRSTLYLPANFLPAHLSLTKGTQQAVQLLLSRTIIADRLSAYLRVNNQQFEIVSAFTALFEESQDVSSFMNTQKPVQTVLKDKLIHDEILLMKPIKRKKRLLNQSLDLTITEKQKIQKQQEIEEQYNNEEEVGEKLFQQEKGSCQRNLFKSDNYNPLAPQLPLLKITMENKNRLRRQTISQTDLSIEQTSKDKRANDFLKELQGQYSSIAERKSISDPSMISSTILRKMQKINPYTSRSYSQGYAGNNYVLPLFSSSGKSSSSSSCERLKQRLFGNKKMVTQNLSNNENVKGTKPQEQWEQRENKQQQALQFLQYSPPADKKRVFRPKTNADILTNPFKDFLGKCEPLLPGSLRNYGYSLPKSKLLLKNSEHVEQLVSKFIKNSEKDIPSKSKDNSDIELSEKQVQMKKGTEVSVHFSEIGSSDRIIRNKDASISDVSIQMTPQGLLKRIIKQDQNGQGLDDDAQGTSEQHYLSRVRLSYKKQSSLVKNSQKPKHASAGLKTQEQFLNQQGTGSTPQLLGVRNNQGVQTNQNNDLSSQLNHSQSNNNNNKEQSKMEQQQQHVKHLSYSNSNFFPSENKRDEFNKSFPLSQVKLQLDSSTLCNTSSSKGSLDNIK